MGASLAVIGAGPKGAALVAKAAALLAAGHPHPPPVIDLYDPHSVGAAWRGSIGYTDGEQALCTLAARDLGFPYDAASYGPAVAQAMLAEFSWQAFALQASGRVRYRDWVVDGRKPPRHRDFADYLEHAVATALNAGAARWIRNRVLAIDHDSVTGRWRVESIDDGGSTMLADYDGVVITGSGHPMAPLPGANPRVVDGRDFWTSARQMQALLSADPDPSVVVVGAGGTAAAIAHAFIRRGLTTLPITIIGREPTLFARHDGPFEDRLFTNEAAWQALAPHVRDAFLTRTTAAVVWDQVLRHLVSDNIAYESYSARGFRNLGPGPAGTPNMLAIELDEPPDPLLAGARALLPALGVAPPGPLVGPPAPPLTTRPASVFVDARGFDRWGFAGEFFAGSALRAAFGAPQRERLPESIGYDLSVSGSLPGGAPFPRGLHLPAIGARQGPAATNLMGLGWLSDRILSRYC